ncbi:hypothetical protein FT663_02692 [Candidozyma haemuli var. vulneris]|uniref:EKC/KEOPS complex subunit CGI121 n=1 Tax=Candidozyma haemuli TaxID=45357 RepID=A0A2V1AYI9_9ASCO|nr:hypothetical protein CXQ85_002543 [[Candida] haemuloni]KAF3987733.1 hypothetical protein FT662_03806 [[Candida] haemuloni var. vulneris]KAF3991506.1 hypothetical protein FT663_02692 [[Candida] haemuloni var. vulneris]PVH22819.1 hypothetical protein CXQ85_002543 [[Candida] haemuloni]
MTYRTFTFPQFPAYTVFAGYYTDVASETLKEVKSQLVSGNKDYDYCFVSTTHLISIDQLCCSLHRSLQNRELSRMKAKTINTEILYNLSPTNNINEALKRFGVDEGRSDVIVLKVLGTSDAEESSLQAINETLQSLLKGKADAELSDSTLAQQVDLKKFLKLFKIQQSDESVEDAQVRYASDAVASSLLRGC